jgi:hypothetical protein
MSDQLPLFTLEYVGIARPRANRAVYHAMSRGDITRPERCEECGEAPAPIHVPPGRHRGRGREKVVRAHSRSTLVAHHDDYSKPLSVRWLCSGCHGDWHRHNEAPPLVVTWRGVYLLDGPGSPACRRFASPPVS